MKTNTTYSILLISLLVPVISVQAIELNASTTVKVNSPRVELRQEVRKENMENRMEMKADIKASLKEARTKKLDDKAKARVEIRLNNIYNMLTNRVDRLTRVDAEITKRIASGKSTPTILTLQAAAQTSLAKAKVNIEATKSASLVELNSTTSKAVLRNLVNTAEMSIKTTGEEYKKVLEAMKNLPKIRVNASSTINN